MRHWLGWFCTPRGNEKLRGICLLWLTYMLSIQPPVWIQGNIFSQITQIENKSSFFPISLPSYPISSAAWGRSLFSGCMVIFYPKKYVVLLRAQDFSCVLFLSCSLPKAHSSFLRPLCFVLKNLISL